MEPWFMTIFGKQQDPEGDRGEGEGVLKSEALLKARKEANPGTCQEK